MQSKQKFNAFSTLKAIWSNIFGGFSGDNLHFCPQTPGGWPNVSENYIYQLPEAFNIKSNNHLEDDRRESWGVFDLLLLFSDRLL